MFHFFSVVLLASRACLSWGHTFDLVSIPVTNTDEDDEIGSALYSSDNKLIVGAPRSMNNLGRVMIYDRKKHDADFLITGEIYGRSAGESFGSSIAMIDEVLFVGAPYRTCYVNNAPFSRCGAVHVFQDTNGRNVTTKEWASHTIVSEIADSYNLFGASLATGRSAVAIGSPGYNGYLGRVSIYQANADGQYVKVDDLSPKQNVFYGRFGEVLGISGRFLAVGASGDSAGLGVEGAGSVHLFYADDTESNWQLHSYLVASNPVTWANFGASLALYGNVLLVGATRAPGHNDNTGAVYVFESEGGEDDLWTESEILIAHDGATGDRLGCSVAMYEDIIAVGACGENGKMVAGTGRAWQASDGENCGDYSVNCIKYQGEVEEQGDDAGALYLYSYDAVSSSSVYEWVEVQKVIPESSGKQYYFGSAVVVNGDTVLVSATGASGSDGQENVGAVYEVKVDWSYYKNSISNMKAVVVSIVVVAVVLAIPIALYVIYLVRGSSFTDEWCDYLNKNVIDKIPTSTTASTSSDASNDVSIRSTHGLLEEGSVRSSSLRDIELASRPAPIGETGGKQPTADWGISRPSRKKPIHR